MSDLEELCEWLRMNSSGYYSQSSDAADVIESMQQDIIRLKAELDCTNKQWVKLDVLPHGTTLDSIKAQGIEEFSGVMWRMKGLASDDGDKLLTLHCDFASKAATKYANNLRNKEGE